MAKTDYSKVEEALNRGLLKITVQHLLDLADVAASTGIASTASKQEPLLPDKDVLDRILLTLQQDLKRLLKRDLSTYTKLGLDKKKLQSYFKNPNLLTPQDWKKVKEIREKIHIYNQELREKFPLESNEVLVELERHRHINKRFNVNEKWLPLK